MPDSLDQKLDTIARHPFRAKFHLRGRAAGPGRTAQGRQADPYRGDPVFVAQHATATCCRNCLQRWHQIPKGRDLTRDERGYVVDVICRWIERETGRTRDG